MKLLRIEIRNFGAFSEYKLDLSGGLNTICHENGWGKSTLAVFIKAMLYGLPANRKSDLNSNERKKYTPWNGGVYGGSLEFACRKGRFRVERVFAEKEARDEFYLYDLSTNRPSDAFGSDLGTELFGVDADGFERSAYLSERTLNPKEENASIRAKLTGLLEDPDDIGCYDEAQERIKRCCRKYEVKGGRGQIADLENELREKRRLLEEKRQRLAEQGNVEQALRHAEQTVEQAEAALQRQQQGALSAAKATALRAQYENLQGAIRQREKRLQEISAAFGGSLPTDSAVCANRACLAEYRNDQRTRKGQALSAEEQQQLNRLSTQLAGGEPSAEELERADRLAYALREAQLRTDSLQRPTASPAVLRLWQTGIPSPAVREQAHRATAEAEHLLEIERTAQERASAKRRHLRAASLGCVLPGVALLLLVAMALLPKALQPLWLGAAGAFLLSFALLQLLAARTKPAATEGAAAQALLPALRLLAQYGLSVPSAAPREALAGLAELDALCRQAQEYGRSLEQYEQRRRTLTEKRDAASRALGAWFATFGLPQDVQEPTRALSGLRKSTATLAALRRQEATVLEERKRLDEKLESEKRAMQTFFAKLTIARAGSTPEDLQAQIEQLCMEARQQELDLRTLRQDAGRFYRENQAVLDAPEVKSGSDTALRTAFEQARARLQALRQQNDRLADETADIPELTDRIAYLQAELENARTRLATLRQTAQFLQQAKNALSTRYLGGMQAALEQELVRLGHTAGIQAVVDSHLELTLREAGASHELAAASQGTRALLQFALRLALTQALFDGGEAPLLLLDDPFISLDAPHIQAALTYLQALGKERQILYLVCHESRAITKQVPLTLDHKSAGASIE